MTLQPGVYDALLGEKIREHNVSCWLINTGWTGGPYGVGTRMDIDHTRAMLNAALSGALDDVPMHEDPIFRVLVPERCPNVPTEILRPENTWSDKEAYQKKALELAAAFAKNFKKFADMVSDEIRAAGPVSGK
jgi:phosphoenolpyruvate carboxykinase (ATP)